MNLPSSTIFLKWHLEGRLKSLPWLISAGLFAASILLWWLTIAPLQHEVNKLNAQVQARQRVATTVNRELIRQPLPQPSPLATALATFPDIRSAPQVMHDLEALAQKHHLPTDKFIYRWVPVENPALSRLELDLTIQGDDMQIRKFLATTMQQLPTSAVEALTLKRVNGASANGEAQIKLVVYFREARK